MCERQRSGYHPHQSPPSHIESSTSSHETLSNPSVSHGPPGDLGVVRQNENSFNYAAKMAKVEACGVDSPLSILSLIGPTTHVGYHEPGHAISISTLVPFKCSALPFANYELATPSLVFAASAASKIDVVPNSSVNLARSPPPFSPIQPTLNEQADAERTDWETVARKLNDYLEAHPEPIIGSISNPFPFVDEYGIRGVSILSALFDHLDMDTFICRLCNDQSDSIDAALQHQRAARHGG